ncbi:hypothetical protein ACTL6P_02705 [Endozoicomonas acroporae]|nr:hypothetical protein [Endozoicomonas acroporae]
MFTVQHDIGKEKIKKKIKDTQTTAEIARNKAKNKGHPNRKK